MTFNPEQRDYDMRQLSGFAEDLAKVRELEPWRFFYPLPKQADFRRFVGRNFQVVLMQGGNWTGKTITGAAACAEIAESGGIQDYEVEVIHKPDGTFDRRYHKGEWLEMCGTPNMGRIIADKEMVEKDVLMNLKQFLHPSHFSTEKKGRPFESQFWLANGSSFDVMTTDQQKKQFEGVNLQWTWINEPPPEDIFHAALGRFKLGGTLFITATILSCAWILDEIIENDNPRYKVVTMHMDENRQSMGGFLPDQAVDDMLNSEDPNTREARETGKALMLAGRVFKGYKPEGDGKHLVDVPMAAPKADEENEYLVVMATDPHDKIPNYSAWAYVKDGVVHVIAEHPIRDFWEFSDNPWSDVNELAREYWDIEKQIGRDPVVRLLDKKFGASTKFGERLTVQQVLERAELQYELWDGSSRAAVNKLIGRYLEQGLVRISSRCGNMDKALRRHRFLEHVSGRAKDEKGQRQDVDEKTRHQIDVLGAILEEVERGLGIADVVDMRDDEPKSEEEALSEKAFPGMQFDKRDYEGEDDDDYGVILMEEV